MKLSEILDITNIPEKDKPLDITLSGPEILFELDFSKLSDATLNGLNEILEKLMNDHNYMSNKTMLEKELPDFSESNFNTRNGYATYDEKTGKDTTGHFPKNRIIQLLTNTNTKAEMKLRKREDPDKNWTQILFGLIFYIRDISHDTVNDFITAIGLPELKKFTKSTYEKYFTDEQKNKYSLSKNGTIKIKEKNILLTPLYWSKNVGNISLKKIMVKITSYKLRLFTQNIWNSWEKCDFTSKASKTTVMKTILESFDWEENYNGQTLEEIKDIIKNELPKATNSKQMRLFLIPETQEILKKWIDGLS